MQNIIFIHGLESSGDGFKGQLLRKLLPSCLTPNFATYNPKIPIKNLLKERMEQLISILKDKTHWIIIASSFGGLMGALFTLKYPSKVSKLILLAPYLSTPALDSKKYSPVDIPVIVFHGTLDEVVPIKRARARAEKIFTNLTYNSINDNHSLQKTVQALDWKEIIKN